MRKFSFTTAFISLLLLYNVSAFSVDDVSKGHKNQKKLINITKKNNDYLKQADLYPAVKSYHRIDIGGKILSYAWVANNSDEIQKHGVGLDGILSVKSVNNNPELGISYGGSFQLAVPTIKSKYFIPTVKAYNRGAHLFVDSCYGNVSFGYQEGVESLMKVDAFTIGSGDNSIVWMQHIGLLNKVLDVHKPLQYHMFPGLYSESLFNGSSPIAIAGIGNSGKDFINSLPFRISYQSPNFMGIRFGISYAPLGYDANLFKYIRTDRYTLKGLKLPPKMEEEPQGTADQKIAAIVKTLTQEQDIESLEIKGLTAFNQVATFWPVYENVVSGGLSYSHSFDNVDFQASIVGEYGSDNVEKLKHLYSSYASAEDLAAFAVGTSIAYHNMIVAGSYGYLGKSGYINNKYDKSSGSDIGVKPMDNEHLTSDSNAYYWTLGAKYTYDQASVSASYFKSSRINYDFYDFNVGIDYNLSPNNSSKGQYKVFGNYHCFEMKNNNKDPIPGDNGSGNVLLVGMKYEF